MKRNYQIFQGANDNWVVLSQIGIPMLTSRRQGVAVAFGKALAHRACVELIVHPHGKPNAKYSGRALTYANRL